VEKNTVNNSKDNLPKAQRLVYQNIHILDKYGDVNWKQRL
jgi:hypothetical protein